MQIKYMLSLNTHKKTLQLAVCNTGIELYKSYTYLGCHIIDLRSGQFRDLPVIIESLRMMMDKARNDIPVHFCISTPLHMSTEVKWWRHKVNKRFSLYLLIGMS